MTFWPKITYRKTKICNFNPNSQKYPNLWSYATKLHPNHPKLPNFTKLHIFWCVIFCKSCIFFVKTQFATWKIPKTFPKIPKLSPKISLPVYKKIQKILRLRRSCIKCAKKKLQKMQLLPKSIYAKKNASYASCISPHASTQYPLSSLAPSTPS